MEVVSQKYRDLFKFAHTDIQTHTHNFKVKMKRRYADQYIAKLG